MSFASESLVIGCAFRPLTECCCGVSDSPANNPANQHQTTSLTSQRLLFLWNCEWTFPWRNKGGNTMWRREILPVPYGLSQNVLSSPGRIALCQERGGGQWSWVRGQQIVLHAVFRSCTIDLLFPEEHRTRRARIPNDLKPGWLALVNTSIRPGRS